jgi:hypothetical protein
MKGIHRLWKSNSKLSKRKMIALERRIANYTQVGNMLSSKWRTRFKSRLNQPNRDRKLSIETRSKLCRWRLRKYTLSWNLRGKRSALRDKNWFIHSKVKFLPSNQCMKHKLKGWQPSFKKETESWLLSANKLKRRNVQTSKWSTISQTRSSPSNRGFLRATLKNRCKSSKFKFNFHLKGKIRPMISSSNSTDLMRNSIEREMNGKRSSTKPKTMEVCCGRAFSNKSRSLLNKRTDIKRK